jgi:KDO2-lipid IV(A) lauroyltransferase
MNSFPGKTMKELVVLEKKFYRHLADLVIETLKLTHLNNKELARRFKIVNPELLERLYDSGRDIIIVHSHYNNWEWLVSIPLFTRYKLVGVYKPLQNKLFDRFINNQRSRNGSVPTPMKYVIRNIVENRKNNIRTMYGFVADQTPAKADIRYSTEFLNQDTPVFLGIEKIAAKYDMTVVFFNVQKIKRGFYILTVELLFETTKNLPEYLVTNTHVKRLEELICEKPEYWIWTHRRWKYNKSNINV